MAAISGTLVTDSAQPAVAATVRLIHLPDSAVLKFANSGTEGRFSFEGLPAGKYALTITGIGFKKTSTGPYLITAGQQLTTPPIHIAEERFTLNEVTIRDKKNYIEVKADKTVLNVERNILAPGTSMLNVLGAAPGVKVNASGEVMMRAGQQAAVFVNGKQIKLQGADLATFLQNLPSVDVSQVELLPNPPVKYDAAGAGGVINILLKKGANIGFNGTITASAGYGRFGKAGLNATGNYRARKINIFGSAGFDDDKTFLTINTLRTINDAQHSSFDTKYYNTQNTPKFNYRAGMDIFLDSLHTLGILVYGYDFTTSFNKATSTDLYKGGFIDSSFFTNSNLKRHISGTNYNINYQGRLSKNQSISADADLTVYSRTATEDLQTISRYTGNNALISQVPVYNNFTNYAPTRITNQAIKVDYVNKLSKADELSAGIKGSNVYSTNDQYFNQLLSGFTIPDAGLTSNFIYKEQIGAAYVNLAHNQKLFSYNAGLRFENLHSNANLVSQNRIIDRNIANFFPSIQFVYKPGKGQYIAQYNRRIDYLDYGIVNPIVAYQDNYNMRAGNPYLQPAITNYVELSYYRPARFKVSLYAQQVSNFFNFNYFSQNDATKVLTTTKLNLRNYSSAGLTLDLPVKVSNFYSFNFNGDVSYQRYKDYNGNLDKGTQDIILKLNQTFNISSSITANLYGQYESNTFYGVSNLQPNYFVSGGIAKQFGRQATLTLNAIDIFNTDRDRYSMTFANLNVTGYQKKESQVVRLTFAYRFGKKTVKGARRHTTGNAEEQKRIDKSGS